MSDYRSPKSPDFGQNREILHSPIQKDICMMDEPIAVGQLAPDFSLPASSGRTPLVLSDLRGQIVVLAFYVLDFTET